MLAFVPFRQWLFGPWRELTSRFARSVVPSRLTDRFARTVVPSTFIHLSTVSSVRNATQVANSHVFSFLPGRGWLLGLSVFDNELELSPDC